MKTFKLILFLIVSFLFTQAALAQAPNQPRADDIHDVLQTHQWEKVDASVERGLAWLAEQQQADGSFEAIDYAQPAVTSFCLMAFLAQGENLNDGKYKEQLSKALDFIILQQKPNGLIATSAPTVAPIPRTGNFFDVGMPCVYNHAISSMVLAEAYGQCSDEQTKKLKPVIEKAIAATLEMQRWKKAKKDETGGWRYLNPRPSGDSDLSLTGWQLMFLRSAKNAGFDVPKESIDAAVEFVERCFLKDRKHFGYLVGNNSRCTRAMLGTGVLALAHAGHQDSEKAIASGDLILKNNFKKYNEGQLYANSPEPDRYHYGMFLCTQAMYHLGGKYWKQFFPPVVDALLANQEKDGGWPSEKQGWRPIGRCYSTSLCILALSVPNQMLPIFQR